jgi:transposase
MSGGKALDLLSPAQHAASELERVAPAALSVSEMAATYRHIVTGDFSRVRDEIGDEHASDRRVAEWLIESAVRELRMRGAKPQLVADGGGWRFAQDVDYDALYFQGRRLPRQQAESRLNDPFSKLTGGRFSEDVRGAQARSKDDITELRESMQENGWVDDPIFYAVQDECGTVLVGHRRLAVAKELGIEPRIRTVQCGHGDLADIKRFQLAVLSNIGHREMTKGDRQEIVKVLVGDGHEWTQMSIAKALGVSQDTISKDVRALEQQGDLKAPFNSDKPKRGRPRKSRSKRDNPEVIAAVEDRFREIADTGEGFKRGLVTERLKEQGYDVGERTVEEARVLVEERMRAAAEAEEARSAGVCTCSCPVHCV